MFNFFHLLQFFVGYVYYFIYIEKHTSVHLYNLYIFRHSCELLHIHYYLHKGESKKNFKKWIFSLLKAFEYKYFWIEKIPYKDSKFAKLYAKQHKSYAILMKTIWLYYISNEIF